MLTRDFFSPPKRTGIVQGDLGLGGLMPDTGKNGRALIAGACLIASALLVGIPIDTAIALRFFSAGLLFGTAILLITLSQWRRFK